MSKSAERFFWTFWSSYYRVCLRALGVVSTTVLDLSFTLLFRNGGFGRKD